MKFIVSVILVALLSVALCIYLPWWSIAIAAFLIAAVIPQEPFKAFLSGFIALLLLWGGLVLYISLKNENILAHKISLLILKVDNPFILMLVTALIGAFIAGLASLSGSYVRSNRPSNTRE